MSFDKKKQADTKGIAIKHSKSSQMHSRSENSHERAMNIARTWNPKNRSRLRRRENLPGTEKMRKDAATLWLMQRPETRQRSMMVAELQSRQREEEEEEGTKGKRKEMTLRSYL